jgi:hypothetical protein
MLRTIWQTLQSSVNDVEAQQRTSQKFTALCNTVQVGPWSRMKRKTVGGVVPDNIPAAQRARTEAAIQVRHQHTTLASCCLPRICMVHLTMPGLPCRSFAAQCSVWRCSCLGLQAFSQA